MHVSIYFTGKGQQQYSSPWDAWPFKQRAGDTSAENCSVCVLRWQNVLVCLRLHSRIFQLCTVCPFCYVMGRILRTLFSKFELSASTEKAQFLSVSWVLSTQLATLSQFTELLKAQESVLWWSGGYCLSQIPGLIFTIIFNIKKKTHLTA